MPRRRYLLDTFPHMRCDVCNGTRLIGDQRCDGCAGDGSNYDSLVTQSRLFPFEEPIEDIFWGHYDDDPE